MQEVKVGLITTLNTNIGDDFIREGICHVLKEVYKGAGLELVSVNKHIPYTVYPSWHPVHLRNVADHLPVAKHIAKSIIEALFPKLGFSRFDDCDLIVQCGAPVFWSGCSDNEWVRPLWRDVVSRLFKEIPVFNIAAGSCYPWERQPVHPGSLKDREYIKSILEYCLVTTVRDRLARNICMSVGVEVPLLPCSAFLAALGKDSKLEESGFILVNYMEGGGHYDWEQEIDAGLWERTIHKTISSLGKRHNLAFLCHSEKEVALARKVNSFLPIFYPKTPVEYFDCVSHAKFAICNRMHASVGMAGMGVTSIAVCTDTRLLMVEELGLPVYYVKNVTADILVDEAEAALKLRDSGKERLFALQSRTWEAYLNMMNKALFDI